MKSLMKFNFAGQEKITGKTNAEFEHPKQTVHKFKCPKIQNSERRSEKMKH
jgi:hypothetical protein